MHANKAALCAEAEEEECESEKEEEDIFALEGETEHLHIGTPSQPQEQPSQERIQGRGGWEGAASGAPTRVAHLSCIALANPPCLRGTALREAWTSPTMTDRQPAVCCILLP